MYQLTEEEKDRIRAEMGYRLALRKEMLPDKGVWERISAIGAHPIIITLLGGLMLSFAAAKFQHHYSKELMQVAYKQQLQERKYVLLASFSEQFNRDTEILVNLALKMLWLKTSNPTDKDHMKRTPAQVQALYDELSKEYMKSHKELAMLIEIKALFSSPTTHELAAALDKKIKEMHGISLKLSSGPKILSQTKKEEINQSIMLNNQSIENSMQALVNEMGREIRATMPTQL